MFSFWFSVRFRLCICAHTRSHVHSTGHCVWQSTPCECSTRRMGDWATRRPWTLLLRCLLSRIWFPRCLCVCVCVCVLYVCIYTHRQPHTHTHTQTHIYLRVCVYSVMRCMSESWVKGCMWEMSEGFYVRDHIIYWDVCQRSCIYPDIKRIEWRVACHRAYI